MPVFRLMYRFKNWVGKRDERLLDSDRVPGNQWLDQSLHIQDDQRESFSQKVRRTSTTLRRLSTVGLRGDKDLNNEECKCLATEMCQNGNSDPVPCFIHTVVRS